MGPTTGRRKKTTETSFKIIELLAELDGARVTEVADELDLSPSTAQEHLATLKEIEFVVKDGDEYYPGLEFLRIGRYVRTRKKAYVLAEEYTKQLGQKLGWRSHFVIEEHGKGVFLHLYSGDQAEWVHEKIGNRQYMHSTATGKAILAYLSEEYCEDVIDRWGLPQITSNTTTDRDDLYEEFRVIRDQGYAINYGENIKGIRTFAVPVKDQFDQVIGAFSVTVPAHIDDNAWPSKEFKNTIIGVAREYELELSLS